MKYGKAVIISASILLITAVASASINFRDSEDINFFSDLDMNDNEIKNLDNSLGSGQNWASYPAGENIKLNGNSLINRYGPSTDISEDILLDVMEESDAREKGDNENNNKLDSLEGTINLFGEIIRDNYNAEASGNSDLDDEGIDPIVEVFHICMTQCPIDLNNKDDIEFEYPVINASAGSITMRANQISSPPTKSLSINSERGITLSGGLNLKKSSLNYRTIAKEADCAGSASDSDFDTSGSQTYLNPSYYDGCGDGTVTTDDTVDLFGEIIRTEDYIMEGGEGKVLTDTDVVTLFGAVKEAGGTLDYAGEPPSYNILSLGSGSTYNFASAKLGRIEASRFSPDSNDQLVEELKIDGSVNVTGDLDVKGSLSKESGSFVIDNPNPESEHDKLKHSFVEAPTRGENIYRYKVNVEGEEETIQLPDYFNHLNEDVQEWVTADEHFGDAYAEVDLEDNEATVHAEKEGEYNLLIVGTRKDEAAKEHWDQAGGLYPN